MKRSLLQCWLVQSFIACNVYRKCWNSNQWRSHQCQDETEANNYTNKTGLKYKTLAYSRCFWIANILNPITHFNIYLYFTIHKDCTYIILNNTLLKNSINTAEWCPYEGLWQVWSNSGIHIHWLQNMQCAICIKLKYFNIC